MSNVAEHWIIMSKYDMETAEAMMREERYIYVSLMCHQAIEKLLKAIWAERKKKIPPRTHNIISLSRSLNLWERFDDSTRSFLAFINPLNVMSRYPPTNSPYGLINKDQADELLNLTRGVLSWLKTELKQKKS